MTYRVISGFEDTDSGVFYDIHEKIEDNNKNIKKYLNAGVVVEEPGKAKKVDGQEDGTDEEKTDYSKLKVDDIKKLLEEREIPFDGDMKKDDLIELLGD